MHLRNVIGAVALAVFVGCSGGGEAKVATVPVKGKLYVDDKPFGPALIQLTPEPADPKIPVVNGYVKQDGSFQLKTYKEGDGAPIGKFKVILTMDPLNVGSLPAVQPTVVEVAKPSGSNEVQLDIKLASTGEQSMSPLPRPGQEGGRTGGPFQ